MRTLPIALALLALTACGKADNDPGPGGVTVGEAKALDEAAEMIESERPPAQVVPPVEQPAPAAPAPKKPGG